MICETYTIADCIFDRWDDIMYFVAIAIVLGSLLGGIYALLRQV